MKSWHQMTWQEVAETISAHDQAAILSVGATEQHGPHMGCGMDAEIAFQLCRAVSEQTGVVMLPTLPFGCSIGHSKRWPGTLALQPKTVIDVVKEIGDWVYASGVRRLFIVNSHVTNFAPLRCALEMLRAEYDDLMISLVNSGELSQRVRKVHFEDAEDWHANDAETSLMLALKPDMVVMEKIKEADDIDRTGNSVFSHPVNRTSTNGVTGTPSLATKEKGQQLFEWMVEDLSKLIVQGCSEQPPLAHSYFTSVMQDKPEV